jgi:hypothetical protein
MSGKPTPRIVYLNGNDTGLKAVSPRHAVVQVANLLRRRGYLRVDEEALQKSASTCKGRVDFSWPVTAP